MKYKLIDSVSKIETICDKVTIDGFDYYVNDEEIKESSWCYDIALGIFQASHNYHSYNRDLCKKVIATTNPNIDVPKVVDETWVFFKEVDGTCEKDQYEHWLYKSGYNKSQETHPFSEEDMIEFAEWLNKNASRNIAGTWEYFGNRFYTKTSQELLQLWKEQKPKIVYYG